MYITIIIKELEAVNLRSGRSQREKGDEVNTILVFEVLKTQLTVILTVKRVRDKISTTEMVKRNIANVNGHAPAPVITTVIVGETEESLPNTGKKPGCKSYHDCSNVKMFTWHKDQKLT